MSLEKSPSSLYRLRKKARFEEMPGNIVIGSIKIMSSLSRMTHFCNMTFFYCYFGILFFARGLDIDNNLHLYILHFLFMDRINKSLLEFVRVWNNHKIRTVNNRTPTQLLLLSQRQGTSCGVNVYEDEYDIYSILDDAEDVVNGDNQVVCDSRYCPFNELQTLQFSTDIERIFSSDNIVVSCFDLLFEKFITALRAAVIILSNV